MDFLSQNWIWLVIAIGGYLLLARMGIGGCGMGHSHGHGHAGSDSGATDDKSNGRGAASESLFDPVSRRSVPAGSTVSSVYQGRAYYFEDRANRDAFESDPEKYLAASHATGHEIGSPGPSPRHSHQGHGCC